MNAAGAVVNAPTRPRFIVPMPRLDGDGDGWRRAVRRIESLGFDEVAVSEQYSRGWVLEPLVALALLTATTTRLRALPLVLNNDLHQPGPLAKAIATINVLSAGRVTLRPGGFDSGAARELSRDAIEAKIDRAKDAAWSAGRPVPEFQIAPAVVVIDGARSSTVRPGFTDYVESHAEDFVDTPAVQGPAEGSSVRSPEVEGRAGHHHVAPWYRARRRGERYRIVRGQARRGAGCGGELR